MPGRVDVVKEGALGWIVFDHPERRNAITVDMWRAIPAAARRLDEDDEVRVVLLRGAGEQAFVSGADISEFEARRSAGNSRRYEEDNRLAFQSLLDVRKPVVAMIHGFCIGGGVALSLTADLRIGADDAVLAIPAGRLGLGYPPHGLASLVGLVGPSITKEILFTARRFTAAEALGRGLLNEVVPKAGLEEHVRTLADGIAANAPLTLRSVKLVVRELARDEASRDGAAIAASVTQCFESDDYAEGVRAFLEKRRPTFRGR